MTVKKVDLGHEVFANCYVLIDEKTGESAIVDPAYFNEKIATVFKDAGVGNLKYILLTHGHFDHILGVHGLKEATGAKVVIHKDDADFLLDPDKSLANGNFPEPQIPVEADITVSDGDELFLGDEPIRVISTPGHTMGSVCYELENDRVLITGDTLFCMTAGRTDLYGGNESMLIESLKRLIALDGDYRVLPGHNRETTLERERARNWYIRRMVK
ncbi:MAG: MBL fold metallo-hydrolase [Clostridia bacterium]|nr:MBL fold metallo-hydrolase [Clostridia bacterium]